MITESGKGGQESNEKMKGKTCQYSSNLYVYQTFFTLAFTLLILLLGIHTLEMTYLLMSLNNSLQGILIIHHPLIRTDF